MFIYLARAGLSRDAGISFRITLNFIHFQVCVTDIFYVCMSKILLRLTATVKNPKARVGAPPVECQRDILFHHWLQPVWRLRKSTMVWLHKVSSGSSPVFNPPAVAYVRVVEYRKDVWEFINLYLLFYLALAHDYDDDGGSLCPPDWPSVMFLVGKLY